MLRVPKLRSGAADAAARLDKLNRVQRAAALVALVATGAFVFAMKLCSVFRRS